MVGKGCRDSDGGKRRGNSLRKQTEPAASTKAVGTEVRQEHIGSDMDMDKGNEVGRDI